MPEIIQFCPTLGTACGIATYTDMLAKSKGMQVAKSLDELQDASFDVLHVQHEFGIFSKEDLQRINTFCKERGVTLRVTMHTIIPLPRIRQYIWHRMRRYVPFASKRWRMPRAIRSMCWKIDNTLECKLRLWRWMKKTLPLLDRCVRFLSVAPPSSSHIDQKLWLWNAKNPDYGYDAFQHFRDSQRWIIENADEICVHNEEAKRALTDMGATNVTVTPHGILRGRRSDSLLSETDGRLHIGVFGFLKSSKGILEIIEACDLVEKPVTLHLFTSMAHDDQHDAYLQAVREKMQTRPWIQLDTKHHDLEELIFELSKCDVNIWYADPPGGISTSGSIRQYVAALRPIIASRTVMVTDIADALTLIPPRDPVSLRSAIENHEEKIDRLAFYLERDAWREDVVSRMHWKTAKRAVDRMKNSECRIQN